MKNFRKVLALVLVVATLFSFAAMAGAKEYTDADKIGVNYDTAVEVLSALEILNGYTDGSFKPQGAITRAEMAKMIAVLSNAGDDVSELYAAACDFADAKGHWAASYIAYCAQTGVVAGYSATAFGPEDNVTGLQTAKMLLVTMGFDAADQGYTGANWKVNVLRDAKNFGLLDGFAAGWNADANITREEAAHMMLNALKAPVVVGSVSEDIVKISNAMYASYPILTLKDAEHNGWIIMYGNVVVAGGLTLGEALYETKLTLDIDAIDCYHRPGTTWTLVDNRGIKVLNGKFVADATAAAGNVAADLSSMFKAEEVTLGYDVVLFVDGTEVTGKTLQDIEDDYLGNGVVYEVYVDDAAETVTVIVINTFIGEITATVKGSNTAVINDTLCFSNKGYGFKEGDVVLYWLCDETIHGSNIHNAKVAPVVTGTVTRVEEIKAGGSFFKADGTNYFYHAGVAHMTPANIDVKYNVYFDDYGYAMTWNKWEAPAAELVYGYFVEQTGSFTRGTLYANGTYDYVATKDVVDFTAAYNKDVKVTETLWNELKGANVEIGTLVEYTVVDGIAVKARFASEVEGTLHANGDIKTLAGGMIAYGNSDSKYLVRTWNWEKGEYQYNAYTEDTLPATFVTNGKIQLFTTLVGVGDYATESSKTGVVTYAFVDALFSQTATKAFILSETKSVSDSMFKWQIGAYDAYKAIVGGAEGYVLVTGFPADTVPAKLTRGMYEGKLQVIGLYDDGLPVYACFDGPLSGVKLNETIQYIGGELVYNGTSTDIAADAKIIVIDWNGKAIFLDGPAALNDYVETLAGWTHAEGTAACWAYDFDEAWFTGNPVSELILTLNQKPATADTVA